MASLSIKAKVSAATSFCLGWVGVSMRLLTVLVFGRLATSSNVATWLVGGDYQQRRRIVANLLAAHATLANEKDR